MMMMMTTTNWEQLHFLVQVRYCHVREACICQSFTLVSILLPFLLMTEIKDDAADAAVDYEPAGDDDDDDDEIEDDDEEEEAAVSAITLLFMNIVILCSPVSSTTSMCVSST
jgi:hypothetical protein